MPPAHLQAFLLDLAERLDRFESRLDALTSRVSSVEEARP